MSKKEKTVYQCSNCQDTFIAWMGQCPSCKSWNSFEEKTGIKTKGTTSSHKDPVSITAEEAQPVKRVHTRIEEFDRLLGGGFVPGSVTLLGGEPGIGKSTLLLEIASCGKNILYISGEESNQQIIDRAHRIDAMHPNLYLLQETAIENILSAIRKTKPELVMIDSIQTVSTDSEKMFAGSVTQIRGAASLFVEIARELSIPIILTGHITKDGQIAGPKVMEHAVDVVLYFETQNYGQYRFIRSVKNRYGSTGEIAVFEMTPEGLKEVSADKSLIHLDDIGGNGSILFPQLDGTRVLPVEVQVLVTPASFANGRRIGENIDISRIHMIAAILEKFMGFSMSQSDIFVRIQGGTYMRDPAADLALLIATASSYLNKPVPPKLSAAGELSLTGIIRNPSHLDLRKKTIHALGIKKIIWGGEKNINKSTSEDPFYNNIKECLKAILT